MNAVYPGLFHDADGRPPTGEHDYILHFDADALPPCDAFWSVTMYDDEGFTVPNDIGLRCGFRPRRPLRANTCVRAVPRASGPPLSRR